MTIPTMSPFEHWSLVCSAIAAGAQAGLFAVAAVVAIPSFRAVVLIKRQLQHSKTDTFVGLENTLHERFRDVDHLVEIRQALMTSAPATYVTRYEFAVEGVLNALDQIAGFILRGYEPPVATRRSYHRHFRMAIDQYPESFGVTTRYRDLKKLFEHWEDND